MGFIVGNSKRHGIGAVRQQHDQTVNTEAETARGGQTVLQSVDVVVIDLCLQSGSMGLALGDLTLKRPSGRWGRSTR